MSESSPRPRLTESEATRLANAAVELAGGARMIYRNPRQPFSLNSRKVFDIEGYPIEVRWGEISSPAIVTAAGYVFEINEQGIELLVRPPKPRQETEDRGTT
ncbi:MAG: protein-L-isoaspartate o-methyltransferase 1 [Thermomicrobiales bacterium]